MSQLALKEKIDHLPLQPGVYQFKDDRDSVIYVGKAKRLRNRVRSYFQESRPKYGKLEVMVRKITDVEVIVTDSEAEALILENNLIKEKQPRYNINLRDDKSYPYICVSNEERPRVFPTRTIIRDGSKYYGPYDHVGKMRNMLETIRQTFDLCTCACTPRVIDKSRGMPQWGKCFEDYFENCSEKVPLEEYQEIVSKIVRILNGKTDELVRDLRDEMSMASESLAFEKAAQLRDSIEALQKYSQKMKIVSNEMIDRDIFALQVDSEENIGCGVLFKIRDGKLLGKYHKMIRNIEGLEDGTILQSFVEDYYTSDIASVSPGEVHVSHELEDDEPLLEYLWEIHGKKVPVIQPKIGEKAQMIRMAQSNAKLMISEWKLQKQKAEKDRIPHSIKALQRDLRLKQPPRRIECFDNSNLQGSDPVASLVCFVDGQPRKSEYKRFNIKTVVGPDDFASMKEVLMRRYSRLMREKKHIPDLIVVDGGKGQLSSAVSALKEIGFYDQVIVIGLAKRLEEVFFPGDSQPIMIPKTSSALKLLQRVRDEAHRFAITFHRSKRSKRTFTSELTEIEGVGEKTAQKLIKEYGSVKQIKSAELESLQKSAGKKVGKAIFDHFQ